jgi:hypothetical protein
MQPGDRYWMYLEQHKNRRWEVSMAGLTIEVYHHKRSRHYVPNCSYVVYRYDVWFMFEGQAYWGVNYGENDQTCHIMRLKPEK